MRPTIVDIPFEAMPFVNLKDNPNPLGVKSIRLDSDGVIYLLLLDLFDAKAHIAPHSDVIFPANRVNEARRSIILTLLEDLAQSMQMVQLAIASGLLPTSTFESYGADIEEAFGYSTWNAICKNINYLRNQPPFLASTATPRGEGPANPAPGSSSS